MKTLLKVKYGDRSFYVLADAFLFRYKISAIDNVTNEPLDISKIKYVLTEIINGKLASKPLGFVSDIRPGEYRLSIRTKACQENPTAPKNHYFDADKINILEQIYAFY